MINQKQLAVKVMELANSFSGWIFEMEQEGSYYLVSTTLSNQKGQKIGIFYQIWEEYAELQVVSIDNKYDYEFMKKRINKISQEFPVLVVEMEDNGICIQSSMSLEILDSQIGTIVTKIMPDMLQAMTDILNYCT